MWGLLRSVFYSMEMLVTKEVLKDISTKKYLAYKYFLGIFLFLIFFFLTDTYITPDGLIILFVLIAMVIIGQLVGFNGLKNVDASTYASLNQARIVLVLLIGLAFGYQITELKIISMILCVVGGLLIVKDEKETSENRKNSAFGIMLTLILIVITSIRAYMLDYVYSNNYLSQNIYLLGFILGILVFYNIYIIFDKKDNSKLTKKQFWGTQFAGVLSISALIFHSLSIFYAGVFVTALLGAIAPGIIHLIEVVLKKDIFTLQKLTGLILTVAGVVIYVI